MSVCVSVCLSVTSCRLCMGAGTASKFGTYDPWDILQRYISSKVEILKIGFLANLKLHSEERCLNGSVTSGIMQIRFASGVLGRCNRLLTYACASECARTIYYINSVNQSVCLSVGPEFSQKRLVCVCVC